MPSAISRAAFAGILLGRAFGIEDPDVRTRHAAGSIAMAVDRHGSLALASLETDGNPDDTPGLDELTKKFDIRRARSLADVADVPMKETALLERSVRQKNQGQCDCGWANDATCSGPGDGTQCFLQCCGGSASPHGGTSSPAVTSSIRWPIRQGDFPGYYRTADDTWNCGQHPGQCKDDPASSLSNNGNSVIIRWTESQRPQFWTFRTQNSVRLLTSMNGFVGVGIAHFPFIPGVNMFNAVWLFSNSLPPRDYLEVDLFEHNPDWWWIPKQSVHSRAGCGPVDGDNGNCGAFLDGTVSGEYAQLLKGSGGVSYDGIQNDWYRAYNAAHRDNPASWNALITPDSVVTGFSRSGWVPQSKPTEAEFVSNNDLVWKTRGGVSAPMRDGFNFLVSSTAPNGVQQSNDLSEAFYDLRWVVIRE